MPCVLRAFEGRRPPGGRRARVVHGIRLRYEYMVTTFALRMPHTSSTSGRPEVSVSTCATVLLLDFYSNFHVITS